LPEMEAKSENEEGSRRKPIVVRWTILVLTFLLSQWQVIGIGIAVILAWLFPNVGRRGGVIESQ